MTIELATLADLAINFEMAALQADALAVRPALAAGAAAIRDDAKAQIGHYQPQVGAYPAWAPLAESTEDEKARLGAPPDAPLERFGELLESFRSELVSDKEALVGSIDPVMEYHEFGTDRMPPRPVLGPALFKEIGKIERNIGERVGALVAGQRMGYRFNREEGGIPSSGFDPEAPLEGAYGEGDGG